MSLYSVNLAKGVVPNAAQRRKRYFFMVGFFALCGALLLEGAWRVATRYNDSLKARSEVARMEEDFRAKHPGASSLKGYADELATRLNLQKGQIMALKRSLPQEVPLAQILFYMMEKVPNDGELITFSYDKSGSAIDVSLRLTVGEVDGISPSELLREWRADADLFKYLKSIKLLDLEENTFVQGHPVVVLNSRFILK